MAHHAPHFHCSKAPQATWMAPVENQPRRDEEDEEKTK
jgi:hypothetical protein